MPIWVVVAGSILASAGTARPGAAAEGFPNYAVPYLAEMSFKSVERELRRAGASRELLDACDAIGGQNIFLADDAGYTIILEPGRKYTEVARNVIESLHLSGHGGNPCKQASFYTPPVFDGSSIYLKGEEYLYCIEEK